MLSLVSLGKGKAENSPQNGDQDNGNKFCFPIDGTMDRATQKEIKSISKHRKEQEVHPWQGVIETACKKAHVDALTTHDLLEEISTSKAHKRSLAAS